MRPSIKYAKSGDLHIAYQVVGEGPFDLIVSQGWVSNIGLIWDNPLTAYFLSQLARFSRLIIFDKRGTGLSDRPGRMPTLEERMDDLRAVMQASGSEQASILGISEGASMSMLFAATYPEKVRSLALFGAFAKRVWSPDYPWAPTPEKRQVFFDTIENHWQDEMDLGVIMPSIGRSPEQTAFWSNFMRMSASPGAALELARLNTQIDVRDVLCCIGVPTLVLHRVGDRDASVEEGRWIASRIPGAKFVALPGEDHIPYAGNADEVIRELEEFFTGTRTVETRRVLSTVLITDLVDSTAKAASVGDASWRALLETHNDIVARSIERHGGRWVKNTGDGVLATFDGPGRALRAGLEASRLVGHLGLEMRAGIHTGEIELIGEDVGGISVHIAARIAAKAGAGQVLASQTVKDLSVGSGISFEEQERCELKGLSGDWAIYSAQEA